MTICLKNQIPLGYSPKINVPMSTVSRCCMSLSHVTNICMNCLHATASENRVSINCAIAVEL